jgi:hypothetical protein
MYTEFWKSENIMGEKRKSRWFWGRCVVAVRSGKKYPEIVFIRWSLVFSELNRRVLLPELVSCTKII